MMSKLKAIGEVDLREDDVVLYLGASHGVTASLIAARVKFVFCLEISSVVMRELLSVCEKNEKMAPLMYDANNPEEYEDKLIKVDFIYQDLAQRNQVEIFKKNAEKFLKDKGRFILIIKAKSIDAVKPAKEVLDKVDMDGFDYRVVDLEKTHKGHYALVGEKK